MSLKLSNGNETLGVGQELPASQVSEALSSYVARDRLRSLSIGGALPSRTRGAALFADISGFTALTEALTLSLGPSRGAEELSTHLNAVYEALVAEVHKCEGSVVAFAGDAITCWFEQDSGRRAAACAFQMQRTMEQFASIVLADGQVRSVAVKAGIACGPARRFLAGKPEIQLLDILAGNTLGEMSDATSLASKGEVIATPRAFESLEGFCPLKEWRQDKHGHSFAVLAPPDLTAPSQPQAPRVAVPESRLAPYLLRPVYERLIAGQGQFLTELRPAVALFMKFGTIDYDRDESAGSKLDEYLRWVQTVVEAYGGALLAVGMGDKGSHLYCCFGAPIAHENSAWRAVSAAEELRRPPAALDFINLTQIGISSGRMRTGAYGSSERRTYGVLGDPVNLAARLMEHAGPGRVLVSEETRKAAKGDFLWEDCAPIRAKGRAEPVNAFALTGVSARRAGSPEPQYALPMVGRRRELTLCEDRLDRAFRGGGQIISLCAEAGLGKSRLVSEVVARARGEGFLVLVGQCQSHARNISYLPWQSVWREFFGLESDLSVDQAGAHLERELSDLDPLLRSRLPLLRAVLNIPLPENEVTRPLEARLRKAALEGLLVECLRQRAQKKPVLLVVEDSHWIDPLSQELMDLIARSLADVPLALLCSCRPPEAGTTLFPGLRDLPSFVEITLGAFSAEECGQLIRLKLEQLFQRSTMPSPDLVNRWVARSSGNPFYIEEILNYLHDTGQNFDDPQALEKLELPASLQSLILSRIDRLTETQQAVLKVASAVGRLFPAAVVWGIPGVADQERVASDLADLCAADLTAQDRPPPELVYIFRHVITQEVAYESLPHATRARLHEKIGFCIERLFTGDRDQHLDVLAFHFDRSENQEKKKEYLLKAGAAAQARYANAAAISYFERVLPMLSGAEQITARLNLGKVYDLTGEWKKAGVCYQKGFETASEIGDRQWQARCQSAMGDLLRKQSMFPEALDWLNVARTNFEDIGDRVGIGQTLHAAGTVAAMQGDYDSAWTLYEKSLEIRREIEDHAQVANLLNNLGILARFKKEYAAAQRLMDEGLSIRRSIGDRWAIANSLNNIGVLARELDNPAGAREALEEALKLNRQVGDRWAVANVITSLGEVAADLHDWNAARGFLSESLRINQDLGDRSAVAFILEGFAAVAAGQGDAERAFVLAGNAMALREEAGSPLAPSEQARLDLLMEPARLALPAEKQAELLHKGRGADRERLVAELLAESPG